MATEENNTIAKGKKDRNILFIITHY